MIRRTWKSRTWALAVPVLFALLAPALQANDRGWLLPECISDEGAKSDMLFWIIFVLTGLTFLGTEGLLLWFIVKYRAKAGQKAYFTHGNHKVEVIWTLIPAVILAVLAVGQFGIWVEQKDPDTFLNKLTEEGERPLEVHVLAKQFDWWFRYPGPDEKWGTPDDFVYSRLVFPVDRPVVIRLKSIDVIHSLYLPELRFKQDAVPGLVITGWFRARKAGKWEIACAELCGESHYKMRGEYEVIPAAEWDAFYKKIQEEKGEIDYAAPNEQFRFWPIETLEPAGEGK